MSTYASAQAAVDLHPVNLAGRCLACLAEGPCQTLLQALSALTARGALPRRMPGATRPELVGARRVAVRA